MSTAKFDTWQDSSGTNEFYKCRAWVSFNGTGTVAINASGNTDSITDNGAGDYTINFANNMPDANYIFTQGGSREGLANDTGGSIIFESFQTSRTVSAIRVRTATFSDTFFTLADRDPVNVAIHR